MYKMTNEMAEQHCHMHSNYINFTLKQIPQDVTASHAFESLKLY
jgi:hypothetical protein